MLDDRTRDKDLDYIITSDNIYTVCYASKSIPLSKQKFVKAIPVFMYEFSFTDEEIEDLRAFGNKVTFNTPIVPSYFGKPSFFKRTVIYECVNVNLIKIFGKKSVCRKIIAVSETNNIKGGEEYYYTISIKEKPLYLDR